MTFSQSYTPSNPVRTEERLCCHNVQVLSFGTNFIVTPLRLSDDPCKRFFTFSYKLKISNVSTVLFTFDQRPYIATIHAHWPKRAPALSLFFISLEPFFAPEVINLSHGQYRYGLFCGERHETLPWEQTYQTTIDQTMNSCSLSETVR